MKKFIKGAIIGLISILGFEILKRNMNRLGK